MAVLIQLADAALSVECRALYGEERLGHATHLEATVSASRALDPAAVLGTPCWVVLETRNGSRTLAGLVTRITAVATTREDVKRTYKLLIRSRLAALELRQRSRIHQKLTVPAIVRKVLEEGGYAPGDVVDSAAPDHTKREYVVQYAESDAAFVRRLCEDDGLYFRFDTGDHGDVFLLEDRSAGAEAALPSPLVLVDQPDGLGEGHFAFGLRSHRRRRVGKVTLRDYDHNKPTVPLEGVEKAGTALEQAVEVYAAPGRFEDPAAGAARAKLRLEALRADALTTTLTTTALALAPGLSFKIAAAPSYIGPPPVAEEHVVTAVRHRWTSNDTTHRVEIDAVPLDVPYRLAHVTPRPRIHGLQSAIVTGAPGEEIHPDALGRVFLHFHWDLDGPRDEKSSLPVRVSQPNMPGSMLLPRVGWEVLVAFEDGDPDRPYVLGRSYTGKMRPPFPLPANKTITSLATDSSPGGAKRNSIHFDDAAGRQHLKIQASFGKTTEVGAAMVTQTVKNEKVSVTADQTRTVGGNEDVTVHQAYFANVGSLSMSIGAAHTLYVTGNMMVGVRTATIAVGAAQLEKVGDPVKGIINLGINAALAVVGSRGTAGAVVAALGGLTKAGVEGYLHGGADGALRAVGMGLLGIGGSLLPGGESVIANITGASSPMPWDHGTPGSGSAEAGGGAGAGATDASAAQGPGPGHRRILVRGGMIEMIGGAFCIVTPGPIGWVTGGGSMIAVGGSHTIKAAKINYMTAGASVEALGSVNIKSRGKISRDVTGVFKLDVSGALTSTATGQHTIKAPSLTMKVTGDLTLDGAHVTFKCGSSKLSSSPSGVLIEAETIELSGVSEQSGSLTHP